MKDSKAMKRLNKPSIEEPQKKKIKTEGIRSEIKDYFYGLASTDEAERSKAIYALSQLDLTADEEVYVLHRLISGLSSTNGGVRLSFPVVLSYLLKFHQEKLTIEGLSKMVEEKLPLYRKDERKDNVIGHIFFWDAVVNSERFKKANNLLKIVKIVDKIYQKHAFLKDAAAQVLKDILSLCPDLDHSCQWYTEKTASEETKAFDLEQQLDQVFKTDKEPSMRSINAVIERCFAKPKRESFGIVLKPNPDLIIKLDQKYTEKTSIKYKAGKNDTTSKAMESLQVMASLFHIFQLAADEDEADFYEKITTDIEEMLKSELNTAKVFEMITGIVARKFKGVRKAGYYLATVFAPLAEYSDIVKFLEIITQTNGSIISGDDEEAEESEDDEFQPITQEELQAMETKQESDSEEEDETSDDDEDDIEDSKPDPALVSALNKSLGRYAITSEDTSDEEELEIDEAEMSALDERLENAMKTFTSKGRKNMVEEAKQYRRRIGELLTILLEKNRGDLTLKFTSLLSDTLIAVQEAKLFDCVEVLTAVLQKLAKMSFKTLDVSKKDLVAVIDKVKDDQKNVTYPILKKASDHILHLVNVKLARFVA